MTKAKATEEVEVSAEATPEETAVPAKEAETTFPLYQLREHSRELFGVKPEVFDGVFANETKTALTKTTAKSRIMEFLKKGVN